MNTLMESDRILEIDRELEIHGLNDHQLNRNKNLHILGLGYDRKTKKTNKLISRTGNEDNISHKNYLNYLSLCYSNHICPVITPDIIWFTIMQELSGWVKEKPEKFRHLFTVSKEKTELLIPTDDVTKIDLHLLLNALREHVPTNVDFYLPKFTTSDQMSRNAFGASFADLVSPFYSYSTFLCGFPKIIIKGTDDDWKLLLKTFKDLPEEFHDGWWTKLAYLLVDMMNFDKDFYKNIFTSKRCGSGGEVEVDGWFTHFFRKQPENLRKTENFASHIAQVDYKNSNTKREFSLFYGIFESQLIDNILYPKFESAIFER